MFNWIDKNIGNMLYYLDIILLISLGYCSVASLLESFGIDLGMNESSIAYFLVNLTALFLQIEVMVVKKRSDWYRNN